METPTLVTKAISIAQRVAVGSLFVSLLAGQIIRFSLPGQGGGILVSDIAIILFLAVAIITSLLPSAAAPREAHVRTGRSGVLAFLTIVPFIIWSSLVLSIRSQELGFTNTGIALLYLLRLSSILMLYPAGLAILRTTSIKYFTKKAFVYSYTVILLLGFLQLIFFPNMSGFGVGWDPHVGRMVGTWLDPNFFGAFLAIGLPAALYWLKAKNTSITKIIWVTLFLVSIAAILLTKSRSTYVAAFVALCACSFLYLCASSLSRHWKIVVLPGVITVCIFFAFTAVLLQERATQLLFRDPTVDVRLDAYKDVWERLVEPNIFFGVGYNAYQFAAKDAGLIPDFAIHSRAGSDSSILTLLVTTGVIGTALFFIPILLGFLKHKSLLYVWVTVFLLVHSLFVNSLLYPHLLMLYIVIALLAL